MSDGIDRVTLTHIRIPFKEPMRTDRAEIAEKEAIIVEIETSGGLTGLGECSTTLDDVGTCWNELTGRIIPAILGRSFTEVDAIAAAIPEWHGCGRRAVASVETALWDLVGQARKASIAALLGAEPEVAARGVDAGLSVGLYPTITDLLRAIDRHLIEGYKQVKIEIAPGLDVDAVKAVRLHFGDELGLMVEANGRYSSSDIETLRVLDDYDLLMIEQPMAADDLDGLAMLQAAITTPVCIDESARSLKDVETAINRRACKVVNLQLHRVGRIRSGVRDSRPLPRPRSRLSGRRDPRSRDRPGARGSPRDAEKLQLSDRPRPGQPMVRRRLRRPCLRAFGPGRFRRPRPPRTRLRG